MVKPQFEVGRENVGSGGVVRDPDVRAHAAETVSRAIEATGVGVRAATDSGVPGPKGNREMFLHVSSQTSPDSANADALIAAGVVRA
jgi:23S rRNA (cytidine1920-2'-O)/16S rRNA (cytidine1409-2'-O)-methyltransferase